jgi:hypothetical protein
MFDRELRLYEFLGGYGTLLTADLTDDQLTVQPSPGVNPPLWILGHLCVVADGGLKLLGVPRQRPLTWHRDFGRGSEPGKHEITTPGKADLLAAYQEGHAALARAAAAATPEFAEAPNQTGILPQLGTLGDLLAHVLTTHEAMHLGQLSAWRRQMGLAGVLT